MLLGVRIACMKVKRCRSDVNDFLYKGDGDWREHNEGSMRAQLLTQLT